MTLTERGEQQACDELALDDLFNPQESHGEPLPRVQVAERTPGRRTS